MRVRHLAVSITAAAVMGAFGPAFAQTSSTDQSAQPSQPSTSASGISNSDVNAGVSANQSATTTNPSSTMNQGASDTTSSSTGDEQGKARGQQADKKTGLDRADEVAGEHGKQGRDNAREKQSSD